MKNKSVTEKSDLEINIKTPSVILFSILLLIVTLLDNVIKNILGIFTCTILINTNMLRIFFYPFWKLRIDDILQMYNNNNIYCIYLYNDS